MVLEKVAPSNECWAPVAPQYSSEVSKSPTAPDASKLEFLAAKSTEKSNYGTKEFMSCISSISELSEEQQDEYWDFVLVVPKTSADYMQELVRRAEQAGLQTDVFEGSRLKVKGDQAVQYCRIGVTQQRLLQYANAIGAPARMNPDELCKACSMLDPPITFRKRARDGSNLADVTRMNGLYPPFLHIYGTFQLAKASLFRPFIAHNRHKLMLRLLEASPALPNAARGAGFTVRDMNTCKAFVSLGGEAITENRTPLVSLFLLHDPLESASSLRNRLYYGWIKGGKTLHLPWRVPVHAIREYLGDQIGFYFLFLSTFTSHCIVIGLLGMLFQIVIAFYPMEGRSNILSLGRECHWIACVFAPLQLLSMIMFLIHFRRRQATLAKEWGCYAWTGGKLKTRSNFRGIPQIDPVNGCIVIDWSPKLRTRRVLLAWLCKCFAMLGILFLNVLIFRFRAWCGSQPISTFWGLHSQRIGVALIITNVIACNKLIDLFSRLLTNYENWKTDGQHCNALLTKIVSARLVNVLVPLVYVAFIKELTGGQCLPAKQGGCLEELSELVRPLLVANALVELCKELLVPVLYRCWVRRKTGGDYGQDVADANIAHTICKRQFLELTEYDNVANWIQDFMDVLLEFLYMSCFGASFPISSLICMIVNLSRLKQDGYKFLFLTNRPLAMEVCNIGAWDHIFENVLTIAVFVSMGIMTKTSLAFREDLKLSQDACTQIWFLSSFFFLGLIKVLKIVVPPISPSVQLQLARQSLYSSRVIFGLSVGETFDEAEADLCIESESLVRAQHIDSFIK